MDKTDKVEPVGKLVKLESIGTINKFPVYDLIGTFPCHACHRGGSSRFGPENTMYSYRRSVWECKTQMLEIDLQLTKDDKLILMHDNAVDRTTNGSGPCRGFTLEEIRKFDAAWNYPDLKGTGIQVPTFDEFLAEFLPEEKLVIFLDFKQVDAAKRTLEVVKERGFDKRIILGSVVPETNAFLAKEKPLHVPLVSDAATTIKFTPWLAMGVTCNWTHDIFGYFLTPSTSLFFSKNVVEQVQKQGKKVVVAGFSLDDREVLKNLLAWGVDIVMTDRPDILRELMSEKPCTQNTST